MLTTLHIMKKIILCLTVLMGFTMSAQTDNTSYGTGALGSIVSGGNYNSAFGKDALLNTTTGDMNTAVGRSALKNNITGQGNTAVGDRGLEANSTGNNNTGIGIGALYSNINGGFNSGVGHDALVLNTSGSYNSACGNSSLSNNTTGTYNTGLGYNSKVSVVNAVNQTVIGANADGQANNSVTLGNSDVTAVYMAEDKGATVYAAGLNLNSFLITATSTILTLSGDLTINSDERLKDNIQPLGSTLNKLHQIEGKTYSFKKDEEHTPKIGVLAQEVQAVFPELVTEGADGILSVNYQGLVPVLINAINEQDAKMSEQDAKIAALEAKNSTLSEVNTRLAQLEELVKFYSLHASQSSTSLTLHRN